MSKNSNPQPPKMSEEDLKKMEESRKRAEASFRKAHGIPDKAAYDAYGSSFKRKQ
jgi:hypothetical protein